MIAALGAKEIKMLAVSAFFGFLLLFPRILLSRQIAPDLVRSLQEAMEPYAPKAPAEFEKARTPAKTYRKKSGKAAPSGPLKVEGIIYEEKGRSSVIINGLILVAGDLIGDYRVVEIQSQHVILKKGENLYVLSADSTLEKSPS